MMTLMRWMIQNTNSEAYRAGRLTGWKHPEVKRELIEAVGGMHNLLEQTKVLEEDAAIGKAGKFKVVWRNMGSDIQKIEYAVSLIPELCRREGIEDPRETQKQQINRIRLWREDVQSETWILPYYDALLSKLQQGKTVSGIEDDNLFLTLNAVAKQKDFIWERVFSTEVLHCSKKFKKQYKERIFHILKNYSPYYVEEMDIDELFAMHGIHSYAQTLEWKGPLQYIVDDDIIVDTAVNRYGTILNSQTIEHAVPEAIHKCRKIMTIENKANYENMSYREDTLYIYCHGFFSPKELKFLKGILSVVDETCEFYHWGDMDFGGICIFQFIKARLFPELKPYKMDVAHFLAALDAGAGMELEASTREKLISKDAGVLEALKRIILERNMVVEQEKLVLMEDEKLY